MTLPCRAPRQLLPLAAAVFVLGAPTAALWGGAALAQPSGGQYGVPPGQQQSGNAQSELSALHAALHITSGQEGAWRAFVAASQPDPQQQARERSAEQMLPTLTAPQRVELSIAAMEADLDTLRERGRALKTFYATLTASQQAVFDRETLPRQEAEGSPSGR